jgi:hypothetical protein
VNSEGNVRYDIKVGRHHWILQEGDLERVEEPESEYLFTEGQELMITSVGSHGFNFGDTVVVKRVGSVPSNPKYRCFKKGFSGRVKWVRQTQLDPIITEKLEPKWVDDKFPREPVTIATVISVGDKVRVCRLDNSRSVHIMEPAVGKELKVTIVQEGGLISFDEFKYCTFSIKDVERVYTLGQGGPGVHDPYEVSASEYAMMHPVMPKDAYPIPEKFKDPTKLGSSRISHNPLVVEPVDAVLKSRIVKPVTKTVTRISENKGLVVPLETIKSRIIK